MKSSQFCSVCKQWLDMEVVPTNDGDDDDGVIWFRCPQCQGFLPKLSGADLTETEPEESAQPDQPGEAEQPAASTDKSADKSADKPADKSADESADDAMPWDSPADMMAAQEVSRQKGASDDNPFLPEDEELVGGLDLSEDAALSGDVEALVTDTEEPGRSKYGKKPKEPEEPAEPIHEYAAMLAELDVGESTPYRPWGTYEEGQCIHHLAWEDCGVVVAKEELPGGRKIIKCYFEDAGVVRLIEQAPR